MADSSWGEIFNLNEELRRIEEEVDRRLEETLAEDPHVIEQETVHYGSPETYRMRQTLPTFEEPAAEAPAVEAPVAEEPVSEEPISEEPIAEEPVKEDLAEAVIPEEEPQTAEESSVEEEEPQAAEETSAEEEEPPVEEEEPQVEEEAPVEEEEPQVEEEAPVEEEEPQVEEEPSVEEEEPQVEEEPSVEEEEPQVEEEPSVEEEEPQAEEEPSVEEEKPQIEENAPVVEETPAEVPAQQSTDAKRRILAVLIAIVVILLIILGVRYSRSRSAVKAQYAAAQALLDSGDYDGAIAAFTEMNGYGDAASQILEAQYAKASSLVGAGSYAEAIDYIDSISEPTDAMVNLRASAVDQQNAALYQQATEALAIYDFDAAEPILEQLGDYEDARVLLQQVQNAIDIVYTDVARDDDGVEIAGETEYLWVHSVITPGMIDADATENKVITSLRGLGRVTDDVDDAAVHVLMMHQATTDAEMIYTDAEPIETDKATIVTKDISSYAGVDDSFGTDQIVYSPQTLQRSNTDYTFAFEGSETYAGEDDEENLTDSQDGESGHVRMECKMADDGYWVKTRRVYANMVDGKLVGVPQHQLRTWTKVSSESVADEVRSRFLAGEDSSQ